MKILKNYNKLWIEILFLLIIVIIGFIFRVYDISKLNLYPDEGVWMIAVKDFLYKNISAWASQSWMPPLFVWISSVFARIFGLSEFSLRFSSVLFGTLTIPLVYYLAKLWYGRKHALLAAILIAILPVHVIYSRTSFSDVMQTFFLLAAILASEFTIKNAKKKHLLISLSGILFALSFLVKYNSIVVWALYWLFTIIYPLIKKNKDISKKNFYYMFISNLSAVIITFAIVMLTGGIERMIYFINNFIFVAVVQYAIFHNPYYFHLAVLFEALSPLLALMLPISIIYLMLNKDRTRDDVLMVFLALVFYAIISVQQRRYVRHQLIVIPFLVIILSRFICMLNDKINTFKKFSSMFMIIVILIPSGWSIYEISKINSFHPWSELIDYLNENYPNETVHASPIRAKVARYYIPNVDLSEKIELLKKDDLVVFIWLYPNTTALGFYPIDEELLLYHTRYIESDYNQEYTKYVLRNGELVKTFEFKKGTTMWLFRIVKTGTFEKYVVNREGLGNQVKLSGLWKFICKQWGGNSILKTIMQNFLSNAQIDTVKKKCSS